LSFDCPWQYSKFAKWEGSWFKGKGCSETGAWDVNGLPVSFSGMYKVKRSSSEEENGGSSVCEGETIVLEGCAEISGVDGKRIALERLVM
jgi:hypothetical protein